MIYKLTTLYFLDDVLNNWRPFYNLTSLLFNFIENINSYNGYQDLINTKIYINIRKNSSDQKILEIMNSIKKSGIVYFKINSGKNEDWGFSKINTSRFS